MKKSDLDRKIFNLTNYQDKQIEMLDSLKRSFDSSLVISKSIQDNLSKISSVMSSMVNNNSSTSTNNQAATFTLDQLKSIFNNIESEEDKMNRQRQSDAKKREAKIDATMSQIKSRIFTFLQSVGQVANNYSTISNKLLSATGASGESVRDTRSLIVQDVVTQLNRETGFYFDAEKAYSNLADTVASASIGSTDAIKELSRPLLLAQESMNTNTVELTKLLGRWYTRYSFNSTDMEDMVDSIRQNTADNNASEAKVQENLTKLENWMAYYAGGDTGKLSTMTDSLSKGSSWLESMGVDSGRYTDYLQKIATGSALSDRQLVQVLHNAGLSASTAQDMFAQGNISALYEALFSGENSIVSSTINGKRTKEQIANAMGMNVSELIDVYNAKNSSGYTSLSNFEIQQANAATAVETIEDKYVSFTEKTHNFLSTIAEHLANIQEQIGFGLSDILTIGMGIANAVGIARLLSDGGGLAGAGSSLLGSISSGGISKLKSVGMNSMYKIFSHGGSTTLANMATAGGGLGGAAMLGGGVLGGGALAIDGIKGLFSKGSDTASKTFSGIEAAGGLAGAGALIGLGVSNPVGWVALAIGGLSFLGKKAYESSKVLTGNAQKVNDDMEAIAKSMHEETQNRVEELSDIKLQFKSTSDIEEQRKLLLEKGLASQKELDKMSKDEMLNLIQSYADSAKELSTTTQSIIDYRKKLLADEQGEQQKDFLQDLRVNYGRMDHDTAYSVFDSIVSSTGNEKVQKYWDSIKDKDSWEISEIDRLINGSSWDALFNGSKGGLKGSTISTGTMQYAQMISDGVLKDINYSDWDASSEMSNVELFVKVYGLYNDYRKSKSSSKLTELNNAIKQNKSALTELKSVEAYEALKDILSLSDVEQFATGSNYIEEDQLALIHEGEAVVPKKYNPTANATELEMLRSYYEQNTQNQSNESSESINELKEVITEIKEFLQYWRDDNIKRSSFSRSTHSTNSAIVNSYFTT